jgi:hypothetical protein
VRPRGCAIKGGTESKGDRAMPHEIDLNSSEPLLTLGEIAPFIKAQTGIPFGFNTIKKVVSPSIATGPKPAAYLGKRPLFRPSDVLSWARSHLSTRPRPTAIEWPAKERERFEQRNAEKRAAKAAEKPAKAAEPKAAKAHR